VQGQHFGVILQMNERKNAEKMNTSQNEKNMVQQGGVKKTPRR
jgi:hypothetical protein